MNEEKLIELVSKNRALYDLNDEKYLDITYKVLLWQKIANELQCDWNLCKSRWTNIRDTYKKSLVKRKKVSKSMRPYKYEKNLQFLLPTMEDRTKLKSCTSLIKTKKNDIEVSSEKQEDVDNLSDVTDNSLASQPHCKRKVESPTLPRIMNYIFDNNHKQQESAARELHPIDAFLQGLAPTLKKLSPYNQHVAKGKIFQIVQEMEYHELTSTSHDSPLSSDLELLPNKIRISNIKTID